ncbi:MAG: ATP-binding protein [Bacteroidales bacterium]|nr:ATP-binding protein [Bacteroidales bacterium]
MKRIHKIVLTGGPCAGKTTALACISDHFSQLGYKVLSVPEVPTMITAVGWDYMTNNKAFYYEGEKVILELQIALEDKVMRLAESLTEPCIVVCDRAIMDISAYIDRKMWLELLDSCKICEEAVVKRYDGIIHLSTAAKGAEKYYNTDTNAQRYEQANEEGLNIARMLDRKVYDAWTIHPSLHTISSSEDFASKMNLVIAEIKKVIEE